MFACNNITIKNNFEKVVFTCNRDEIAKMKANNGSRMIFVLNYFLILRILNYFLILRILNYS